MKLIATCFLILMSISTAAWAAGESFSFRSGHFDSKHFLNNTKADASLKYDSIEEKAYLKISQSLCNSSSPICQSMKRVHLDQVFVLRLTQKDDCNVRHYESGTLPARRAVSKLSRSELMLAKIEMKDSRLSRCAQPTQKEGGIQVTVHTKSTASVGTSTLQFDAIQTEMAYLPTNQGLRAPALMIKGESTLMMGSPTL